MKQSIYLLVLPVARRPGTNGQHPVQSPAAPSAVRRPSDAPHRPQQPRGHPMLCGARAPLALAAAAARSLAPRRAREKTAVTTALPAGCLWLWPARPPRGYSPPRVSTPPFSGLEGEPRKRTPTRGKCPPSPPSGAFRAFRYYTGAIIRGRGREGGAPSIPKSLPPTHSSPHRGLRRRALAGRVRLLLCSPPRIH